jgi:hypothetical protein
LRNGRDFTASRPLKVFSVCSGTDSPVKALEVIFGNDGSHSVCSRQACFVFLLLYSMTLLFKSGMLPSPRFGFRSEVVWFCLFEGAASQLRMQYRFGHIIDVLLLRGVDHVFSCDVLHDSRIFIRDNCSPKHVYKHLADLLQPSAFCDCCGDGSDSIPCLIITCCIFSVARASV